MNSEWMIMSAFAAALPAAMIARNLRVYRPLPKPSVLDLPKVSVLIPARNEVENIGAALDSILQSEGVPLEVLVWDDASTDGTAEVVRRFSAKDGRVRLIPGTPPPPEWAGKPFGCWNLAQEASGDILLFLDADVRLRGQDSVARMAAAFLKPDLDLLSGVPWQRVVTLSEVMIVPLIHFVLLGFLPMTLMRASTDQKFAAACGQLMLIRRSAYLELGGHAAVRNSFHEGLGMARAFRKKAKVADLFDASDVAVCRMYTGFSEVWRGFAKNAHEGLASVRNLLPFGALLGMGQVLPLVALLFGWVEGSAAGWAFTALCFSFAARGMLAVRFNQPFSGVVLQPLAVALLLLNQWYGAFRFWTGKPVGWKGRTLAFLFVLLTLVQTGLALGVQQCPPIVLEDQNTTAHEIRFPRQRPLYIVAAGRLGAKQIAEWVRPIRDAYGDKVEIFGLADVAGVPAFLRGGVRMSIRNGTQWPVLMDWTGEVVRKLCSPPFTIEIFVVHANGKVALQLSGPSSPESMALVRSQLDGMLIPKDSRKGSPR